MPKFQPVLFIIGLLLGVLSVAMVVPAIVDVYYGNPDWQAFIQASFITCFIGVTLMLTNKSEFRNLSLKQAFILTTFSWVILAAFAALPFKFSGMGLSYTDAYFETMSGLTTTGSTVIVDLDNTAPGLLLWRAILQWLGGIGIIVVAIAILPMLKIGGMQLFRTESSDRAQKILPRATQISGAIVTVYILITFLCAFALWMAGMNKFDAVCHAFSTIATGRLSTKDASISYFNSALIEGIVIFFMIVASLPFVLYIQILHGRGLLPLWRDQQVRLFLLIIGTVTLAIIGWQYIQNGVELIPAFRHTLFSVVSVITTTGFASTDYNQWGGFVVTAIFLLTAIGGCTGSTSGGLKVFRLHILHNTAQGQLNRLIHPHGVYSPKFNGMPVSENIRESVMGFFILFCLCFVVLALGLSLTGLDYVTSLSSTLAAMANVGPGLGTIVGPTGNFSTLPDVAKWMLSAGMLIGRLELFTVVVMFTPYFWRD